MHLSFSYVLGENFGYISYTTYNIGDDIQAIAARHFLPENSIPIDREFIAVFSNHLKIKTIINGWYIYTKNFYWYRTDIEAPEKSWPPANSIDPLLISIHFTKEILPAIFTKEGIEYLKEHAPVGARDLFTLNELQKRNIPSYFSGCLTLTLDNSCEEREDVIYAVDIDEDCINYIKGHTLSKVEFINHMICEKLSHDFEGREKYAKQLLEKYKRAKCVITSRLHAFLPCLAFETPVLLINVQEDQYRFDGLRELGRNCFKRELINGEVDFNFDMPEPNPKSFIPIRENLIKIVKDWVEGKEE